MTITRAVRLSARKPIVERFWAKVQKATGCWAWTGVKTPDGYGRIYLPGRQAGYIYAHRFAYEAVVGPIPAGMQPPIRTSKVEATTSKRGAS